MEADQKAQLASAFRQVAEVIRQQLDQARPQVRRSSQARPARTA